MVNQNRWFSFTVLLYFSKALCLTGGIWSIIIIPKGKAIHLPPSFTSPRPVWIPLIVRDCTLFLAQLLGPQVCCRLFLNSCYSGATACARNIKHSNSLSLIPSLTVGNCSHHRLTSTRRTVHTSVKCQPKSPSLFLPGSLAFPSRTLPCTHKHTISLLSFPQHSISLFLSSLLQYSLCLFAELSFFNLFWHGKHWDQWADWLIDYFVISWRLAASCCFDAQGWSALPFAEYVCVCVFLQTRRRKRQHRSAWPLGAPSSSLRLSSWLSES